MAKNSFIFHDVRGSRWRRFKFLAGLGAIIGITALVLFVQALLVSPKFDQPNSLQALKKQIKSYEKLARPAALSESDKALTRHLARATQSAAGHLSSSSVLNPGIRAAFFAGWDEAAFRSLTQNHSLLTHLCPEWLSFTSPTGGIQEDDDAGLDRIPASKSFKLMPVLSNLDGSKRIPEGVEFLAQAGGQEREKFIEQLAAQLHKVKAAGVVVDWEEIDPGLSDELTDLMISIADGLRTRGLETWLCVTMDAGFGAYDFDRLAPHVDRFVAFLHDENGEGDTAGPLASQDWFDGWMKVLSKCASPEKWIASLGSYGCDWEEGSSSGEQISFADAMSRAGNAGASGIKTADPTFNGSFSYYYEGTGHDVWFLDAASFANQLGAVRDYGFGGVMVNRLGIEDPAVWSIISAEMEGRPFQPDQLIPGGNAITSIGTGEIVSLDPTSANGRRTFTTESNGELSCKYDVLPSYPTLFRIGSSQEDAVALTFDDGPDPEWTPAILDILKANGVKATFFVVGSEAERHPELVHRIIEEGHEIGNHSFTHPNLAEAPPALIKLELNASQRLIESLTGRSTTLFRPPYNADSRPSSLRELLPIQIAQSLGYMTILENVDPRDWQKPGKTELLDRVKTELPRGNIILLHDGGGDRSATVAALPAILDHLKERGNRAVLISDLLSLDKDEVMQPLTEERKSIHLFASGIGFHIYHSLRDILHAFLVVATILVLIRTILILILARTHKNPSTQERFEAPPVTVLVPAFNEEKVIAKTIQSLLASKYHGKLEILVIDDGSTDATADAVLAINDSRVRLISQKNSGKAHALQRGVKESTSEFLVFVDADTQFEQDALQHLVSACQDPKVGAVSGHARVGNLKTFLARCQDLEYVCGFNLDRRAYAAWNCITVAPGAISVIRKSAIQAAGGFPYDTLAEDTDLTLAIHRAGYRIEYQPDAVAHTEAPETFSTLARQRFRWAYGTMQCAWKHRDIIFNPRFKALAWFSLPGIWFFQVILVAFSPFVDLLFLQSLLFGNMWDILPYFLAFLLCDLLLSVAAVAMEGLPLRTALLIIPQRFVYRPLLSYVIWKSILHALRGAWVGWGKLQRTASVSMP
jgi:cellulose synthase/poly-beta-1,6-N-acetylglucosamine synthase-like glycosyltransferase/peptidoglycan/xylan/chitin deacetylase (PgdA/CDA1 family)/spore germination protein YaaH